MSKVTKDQYIEDLEHDRNKLADMVIKLKAQLESIVKRVPSKLLTEFVDVDKGFSKEDVKAWKEWSPKPKTWIYESPDKGKTVYRRKFNDYDTPRERVDSKLNPYPTQMDLFEDK